MDSRHLDALDELLARPFPTKFSITTDGFGGPTCHVVDLEFSRDFWEDSERDQIEVVWDEYEDKARVLADALDARHGAHRTVALGPYFERAIAGEDLPEPLDHLSGLVVHLHVWTLAERWLAVGVGQQDKELPIQLIAAIGAGAGPVEWLERP